MNTIQQLAHLRILAATFGRRAEHFRRKGNVTQYNRYLAYRARAFALQNKIRSRAYTSSWDVAA